MSTLRIGSGSDYIILSIDRRVKPDAQDYWDANWLHCTAEASAAGFRATVEWQLRNEDLIRFLDGLEPLADGCGEATLDTTDAWLELRLKCFPNRRVEAFFRLTDNPQEDNSVETHMTVDATVIPVLTEQLRALVYKYPVLFRSNRA
jgi:hypothetical protein